MSAWTRRQFVAAAATLPWARAGFAQGPEKPQLLFLGTDTGKGIYRAWWEPLSGAMSEPQLAIAADRPDFFARHPTLPVLYAVNSVGGAGAAVSAYRVDTVTGSLTLLGKRQTHGDGPCAVSVDATGWCVFAANYASGSMTAFQLGANGTLTETIGVFRYTQPEHGPVHDRQDAAHLHCVTIAPGNGFVVTCDLGDDVILLFPFAAGAAATVQQPLRVPTRPGSGPRHVAFHPNGRWMYCINELDCTIDLFDWNATAIGSKLTPREGASIATVNSQAATNTACEVVLSDDGRFLYACTRGENSIAVFRIGSDGLLTAIQQVSCGGVTPRYMAFDPWRNHLVCCNQAAPGSLTVFNVGKGTGRLTQTVTAFAADTPMFVEWM